MATRYPGATFKPLGRQSEPRMVAHDIVCAHTMVSSLAEADRYFRTLNGPGYDGTESHYGVGGAWRADVAAVLDGVVWQWQDRGHQADANGPDGNGRVISIETADNAPKRASDIAPWSDAQVEALVDLIVWECSPAAHEDCPAGWDCHQGMTWRGVRVAIPPVLIPDTKLGRRGLAVHRQGVRHSRGLDEPGFLATGGMRWSTSTGKECPGDERVRQFVEVVIPEVQRRILVPPAPERPDKTEDDMQVSDELELGPANAETLGQKDAKITVGEALVGAFATGKLTNTKLDETNELLRELIALHKAAGP
jgi:hypothetical protein